MGVTSNGAPSAIDYKSIELNDHPYYSWYLNAIMGSCQLKCMFFKYSFFVCLSGICLFVQNFFTKKVAEKFGWYSLNVVILHPQSRNNVRVAEGCESFFEKIT